MAIAPISDYLVVRDLPDEAPKPTGLIVQPNATRVEPKRALVLAAGPGRTENGVLLPMPCVVGDTVLLQYNAGCEVTLDGELVRLVPAKDLYGVLS